MAALHPVFCPPHNWIDPATSCTSSPITIRIGFPRIRQATSAILMGCTPGLLSRAMRRQAVRRERPSGSTKWVLMHCPRRAMALISSVDAPLKAVQMCRQAIPSRPDGSAAPHTTEGFFYINIVASDAVK